MITDLVQTDKMFTLGDVYKQQLIKGEAEGVGLQNEQTRTAMAESKGMKSELANIAVDPNDDESSFLKKTVPTLMKYGKVNEAANVFRRISENQKVEEQENRDFMGFYQKSSVEARKIYEEGGPEARENANTYIKQQFDIAQKMYPKQFKKMKDSDKIGEPGSLEPDHFLFKNDAPPQIKAFNNGVEVPKGGGKTLADGTILEEGKFYNIGTDKQGRQISAMEVADPHAFQKEALQQNITLRRELGEARTEAQRFAAEEKAKNFILEKGREVHNTFQDAETKRIKLAEDKTIAINNSKMNEDEKKVALETLRKNDISMKESNQRAFIDVMQKLDGVTRLTEQELADVKSGKAKVVSSSASSNTGAVGKGKKIAPAGMTATGKDGTVYVSDGKGGWTAQGGK